MNNIIFWASDFSSNSGEGRLAQIFIKGLKQNIKFKKIIRIDSKFIKLETNLKKKFFSSVIHKYVVPFYGVLYLWNYYFKNYRLCYLNYLPLWNFLIFLVLPPNCILGPITGTINKKNHFFLKSFCERISEIIIKFRYKNVIFANNFYRERFKNYLHNFIIYDLKINQGKYIKKYDFIFYIRKDSFNKNFFLKKLIDKLIKFNFRVVTIGDKIQSRNVINFGYQSNKFTEKIISSCKYSVGNPENLYSFFTQDCLKNNVTVFYNNKFKKYEKFKIKNLHPINYENYNIAINQILKKIKKNKNTFNFFFKKNSFNNYFKNLL